MVTRWLVYILCVLALFNISSSLLYGYDFLNDVISTYNESSHTYTIKEQFAELYLANTCAWLLSILVIIIWLAWFLYKNICKSDESVFV